VLRIYPSQSTVSLGTIHFNTSTGYNSEGSSISINILRLKDRIFAKEEL
jgi:hypothetical protein